MAISSGEGPSRNNTSGNRKRPRITIRHRSRESEELHIVEAQGESSNHEDRERDAREGRERQNEEIEEEAEDAIAAEEEESEDVIEESFCGEKVNSGGDGDDGGRDESIRVTLTNPNILNCCICCQPLTIPVFQCENGHIACSTCCVQLADKCYSCTAPIGNIRCLAIEKVLESLKISCRYARHGCKEKITHVNKRIHEKDCIYTPCWCPIYGCQFTAPSKKLSQHINNEHHGRFINFYYDSFLYLTLGFNQKVVVLKEGTDSNMFIIKNDLEYLGNTIKVFHIGPKSSAETYRYDLYVRSQGCCLKLDSFVNHTLGNNFPATTKFLLVPIDFLSCFPEVNIEIRIYKVYESSRRE
ncbi:hypothetical protein QN277_019733 [Acacia crassicarpa]|uniref:SIAH-type domain-containing protein n=1 Tax=Acacia crassicarpa TaxID=499986 RepID=A0AAE1MNM1_9FABA|nr:hypothetical protein QN277_019733 [Acacia crassicarpa]